MSKQVNVTIGHIECSECKAASALRRDKGGKLYFLCLNCGKIAPNHAGGQKSLKARAHFWGAEGAPDELPAWIRENWSYTRAIREFKKGAPPEPVTEDEETDDDLPTPTPPPPRRAAATPKPAPAPAPKKKPAAPQPALEPEPAPPKPADDGKGFGFLDF